MHCLQIAADVSQFKSDFDVVLERLLLFDAHQTGASVSWMGREAQVKVKGIRSEKLPQISKQNLVEIDDRSATGTSRHNSRIQENLIREKPLHRPACFLVLLTRPHFDLRLDER